MAYLTEWLINPGLQHLAVLIFKNLDLENLANCQIVSKHWKTSIILSKLQVKHYITRFIVTLDMTEIHKLPWTQNLIELDKRLYKFKDIENLKMFLKNSKIHENLQDQTLLDYTVKYGHHDIVILLLEYTELRDIDIDSIHYACEKGHFKVIKILLGLLPNAYAKLNETDENGRNVLHHACRNYDILKSIFDYDMAYKINFNARDIHGYTPFHNACREMREMKNEYKVVKLYLEHSQSKNIMLNSTNYRSETPLFTLCLQSDVGKTKLILEYALNYGITMNLGVETDKPLNHVYLKRFKDNLNSEILWLLFDYERIKTMNCNFKIDSMEYLSEDNVNSEDSDDYLVKEQLSESKQQVTGQVYPEYSSHKGLLCCRIL